MFSIIKKNNSIPLDKLIEAKNLFPGLTLAGYFLILIFSIAYAVSFFEIFLKKETAPRLTDTSLSPGYPQQGVIEKVFGLNKPSTREESSLHGNSLRRQSIEKGGSIDTFKLAGTIITEHKRLAVFEDIKTRRQYILREGESMNDFRVTLISRKSVELQTTRAGENSSENSLTDKKKAESTDAEPQTFVKLIGPHHYEIAKRVMLDHFKDPGRFLSEVRLIPYVADGKSGGFVLRNMQEKGFLSDIGFKEGDIVTKINGQSLSDTFTAIKNFASIGELDSVFIELSRENKNIVLKYTIR
jgi:type II secretory pathway component PulC